MQNRKKKKKTQTRMHTLQTHGRTDTYTIKRRTPKGTGGKKKKKSWGEIQRKEGQKNTDESNRQEKTKQNKKLSPE